MTPRERAEAVLRFAGLSSTPCGTIPIVGLPPCDLPAGHRCAHYDNETWEKWKNAELAQDAPALARDLLAAEEERDALRKVVRRALMLTSTWAMRPELKARLHDILTQRDAALDAATEVENG